MSETFKYRAFLAYSHEDASRADWLRQSLENYRVPAELVGKETEFGRIPKRLFPIFRDREELAGSAELGSAIEKALKESSHLVVLCSPAAAKSIWVNEEIRVFKSLGKANRVLCLILDGEPSVSMSLVQSETECLPIAARRKVNSEGKITEEPSEPAAADLREEKDGEHGAFLKIVAGMLGVGLDDLKRRDIHSRQLRTTRIAIAASAVAVLGLGLAGYALIQRNQATIARVEAENERRIAEDELAKTKIVTNFVRELFLSIDPENTGGMDTGLVKAMLDQGSTRAEELKGEPEIEARIRLTLGRTYRSIGAFDEAENHLVRALSLFRKLPKRDQNATLATMNELAVVHDALGNYVQAEPIFSSLLRRRERLLEEDHPDVVRARIDMANLYRNIGRFEEAEKLCAAALAQLKASQTGEGNPDLLHCMGHLSDIYLARNKLPQAETLARNALELSRIHLGEEHPDTLRHAALLAKSLHALERLNEAEKLSIETVAGMKEVLGEEHPDTLGTMDALAKIVAARGQNEQALSHYRNILATKEAALGTMHPGTFETMKSIARLHQEMGALTEAEQTFFKIYERMEEKLGHKHPETLRATNDLAEVYLDRNKTEEAYDLSERILETELRILGDEDPLTMRTQVRLAELHHLAGRKEEALTAFTSVLETQERVLGFDHPDVVRSRDFLNRILAERSTAEDVADSNSSEKIHPKKHALAENVLPSEINKDSRNQQNPKLESDGGDDKTGAVKRIIGNVRAFIGVEKNDGNATEAE